MSEKQEDNIQYGILFVFDNGEAHQEWYSTKSDRDFVFINNAIYKETDESKFVYIGDMMLNKEHFLYAKKIERTKKDIRASLGL